MKAISPVKKSMQVHHSKNGDKRREMFRCLRLNSFTNTTVTLLDTVLLCRSCSPRPGEAIDWLCAG